MLCLFIDQCILILQYLLWHMYCKYATSKHTECSPLTKLIKITAKSACLFQEVAVVQLLF